MPFVTVDDRSIHYALRGPLPTEPGRVILFVHGSGGNHTIWMDMIGRLGEDHTCLAIDLPGRGGSRGPGEQRIEDYSRWTLHVCEALSIEAPLLAGHSLGGAVVMDLALTRPEFPAGLILFGTGARLRVAPAILQALEAAVDDPSAPVMEEFAFSSSTPKEIVDRHVGDVSDTPPRVRLDDMRACDRFDIMDTVSDLRIPTLILCGEDDLLTPPKYAAFLQQCIQGATLMMVAEAGHMVMIEKPGETAQAVRVFLDGLGKGRRY